MNHQEALELLERELAKVRPLSHADLAQRIGGSVTRECAGADGAIYQIEMDFLWDDKPGGNIRVMASIDDGGWRALAPLTRSFIKRADGSFVDEEARQPRRQP
jgi:hypothetical protein